jgi:two-component system, OmpR family, response regulator
MAAPPLRRIALVDDQREIRSVVQLALGKIGRFDLRAFESGANALAEVPAFLPDLLLLDMNMPGLDGLATLAGLRERGVRAPVIFFTSKVAADDIARYQAAGALGAIAKPFDPLKLAAQIRALWVAPP